MPKRTPPPHRPMIRCRDHTESPATVICWHLMVEPSQTWYALPARDPKITHDFVCEGCWQRGPRRSVKDLSYICLGCVGHLRRVAGLPSIGDTVEIADMPFLAEVVDLQAHETIINVLDRLWAVTRDEIVRIIPMGEDV